MKGEDDDEVEYMAGDDGRQQSVEDGPVVPGRRRSIMIATWTRSSSNRSTERDCPDIYYHGRQGG